jgi:hypothetical protein
MYNRKWELENGECESLDYIDPERTESILTEIQLILEG